jgi:hypothetical protein
MARIYCKGGENMTAETTETKLTTNMTEWLAGEIHDLDEEIERTRDEILSNIEVMSRRVLGYSAVSIQQSWAYILECEHKRTAMTKAYRMARWFDANGGLR